MRCMVTLALVSALTVLGSSALAQDVTPAPSDPGAAEGGPDGLGPEVEVEAAEAGEVELEASATGTTQVDEALQVEPEASEAPGVREEPAPGVDGEEDGEAGEDVVESLGVAIGQIGETLGRRPEPNSRLQWDPTWPRYRFDELVLTAGMGLVIVLESVLPTRTDALWTSVTGMDLEVARTLGLRRASNREIMRGLSTGVTAALVLWPAAIDSLLYAGLGEGAWDVAWQLSLISLEVFSVNHVLSLLVRLLTRRERPVGRFCNEDPGYASDPLCANQPPANGFWSDSTSTAFAGAAMVCWYHDALDLFGEEATDFTACGTAIAAAAASGLFRIMSDDHWVTDVLTGAVVGSLSGILLPWLLHFQGGGRPPLEGADTPPMTFMPMMGPDEIGLSAFGMF